MIATFTPARLTPLPFERAAAAMKWALGEPALRPGVLALALAKAALETYRWRSMWNDNVGNVKASDTYVGQFTSFACGEELKEGSCWFEPDGTITNRTKGTKTRPVAYDIPPGHPQTRFRAFANEFDGALEYVDFVDSGYYAAAWKALLTGDARAYVHQLKLKGYFTALEEPYAVGVISLQKEFQAKLNGLAPEPVTLDWRAIHASANAMLARSIHDFMSSVGNDDLERPTTDLPSA